jgi:lipoprotein-anchoring transpeptidase ErfK/SrfK
MDPKDYEQFKKERAERRQAQDRKFKRMLFKIFLLLIICVAGIGSYKFYTASAARGVPAGGPLTTTAAGSGASGTAAKGAASQPGANGAQAGSLASVDGNIKETPAPHDYSILVKKGEYKLYLLDKGQPVAVWGVALGKNAGQKTVSGDMKTPDGTFEVDEIDNASTWTHDFGDGKGEIKGAYGPWFLSLNTDKLSGGKWGGIGIHGTHDPNSIGTRASEGCIRLQNENLLKLKSVVKVGTKVTIEE